MKPGWLRRGLRSAAAQVAMWAQHWQDKLEEQEDFPVCQYIPTDLTDALDELDRKVSDEDKAFIRYGKDNPAGCHFGFGMNLRNSWGLWHDSRLAKWFKTIGIWHADDMSGIILDAWYCRLRGERFDLEREVEKYHDHWRRYGLNPKTGEPLKPGKVEA